MPEAYRPQVSGILKEMSAEDKMRDVRSPMMLKMRLQHAAQELVSTSDSITTIALRCGFSDSNYFKDSFKKKYGVTPRNYRKIS